MPAQQILSAWTALEVLSPQSFKKEEDVAAHAHGTVISFVDRPLPWFDPKKQQEAIDAAEAEAAGEKKHKKAFYQLVLGTIGLQETSERLLGRYADSRIERPNTSGQAILAAVVLNNCGQVVQAPAIVISSFGWGFAQALGQDLKKLADWPSVEKIITEDLGIRLGAPKDEHDGLVPLDKAAIQSAYQWLIDRLKLPPELCRAPYFVVCSYKYEAPEPLVLNSFYLGDLARARTLISNKEATHNLKHYLGIKKPLMRHSLLENTTVLEGAVSPTLIPPARWPGMGRHSLVLLQQAAVNLALNTLKAEGILAVNGPPGTGKTTLLRDMVAAVVTARAEALCTFDYPASAFSDTAQSLEAGRATLLFHRLDARLKGFEMLVASSNNKAVENVSAELPNLSAIAEECDDLRYFKSISDTLAKEQTWGLIAAVLGNSKNRYRFREAFWWDKDRSFLSYLSAAMGYPPVIEVKDPKTHQVIERRPARVVTQENPPKDLAEALERWQQARKNFRDILKQSNAAIAELVVIRETIQTMAVFLEAEALALKALQAKTHIEQECLELLKKAQLSVLEARAVLEESKLPIYEHQRLNPGFFAHLFRTKAAALWHLEYAELLEEKTRARKAHDTLQTLAFEADRVWRTADQAMKKQQADYEKKQAASLKARRTIETAYQQYEHHIIDPAFFDRPHADKHKTAPWCDQAIQQKRDAVFVAAMKLHRAFIDAAAKPLKHNLGILMNIFAGRLMPVPEKKALVPDLWASLFLVVPCLSTTFASVERMLCDLPPESLGWLFIDEAGQALPQAALGAIMRAKRALLVGDPMQIQPVVALPETLTQTICRSFGVDPAQYNAPEASAQTLAVVAYKLCALIQGEPRIHHYIESHLERWCAQHVGTVHTVQGREAEAVFFVLGAPEPKQQGARGWAGTTPNLLNVAMTRAKEAAYVIGNRDLWKQAGLFQELDARMS
ncbi:MAG: ATP-binding protein [Gammaproteobacteria bacterium]|nr:ATP-binding protein [Gammaproteobacteria bacterium]MBP9728793.1 ATP-binding protein [Gammaproteobacteria bacterium]